jgi:hypothetical protein
VTKSKIVRRSALVSLRIFLKDEDFLNRWATISFLGTLLLEVSCQCERTHCIITLIGLFSV